MAKASIWAEVKELEAKGERPVIRLPPAAKVVDRRPPGRPRVRPHGAHQHWNWKMKTPAGVAMRCRNHGCANRIPARVEDLTCSESCKEELRRYCEVTLSVLNGETRARDYPPDLRGTKNSQVKRKKAA